MPLYKYSKVVKSGRLANGAELGKGYRVHAHEQVAPYISKALCGDTPAVQWTQLERDVEVTCEQCLKRMKANEQSPD